MLQKYTYLEDVLNSGVVAVVRGKTKAEAKKTAIACIDGGVKSIELTFTAPHAEEIISELDAQYVNDPEVALGAGTVLDAATARLAIIAGARFIVSPAFNQEVALICNLYAIPYVPGCMTPTEVQKAMSYGSDLIKLFPGSIVGQDMIAALRGPFPQVNLMITGGVSLDNAAQWFENGAAVLGAGANLTGPAAKGDFDAVKANAHAYRKEINAIRQGK